MTHRPPSIDAAVDGRAVGTKFRSRSDMLLEEVRRMMALHRRRREHLVCKVPGSLLLREHEGAAFEERLVHLHDFLENNRVFGQMRAEQIVPVTDRSVGTTGERHGLLDGNLGSPTPQEDPEFSEGNFHISEPGMREQGELATTTSAPIPVFIDDDLLRTALRTKDVLPEDNPPKIFSDLRFRWYLIEVVVHIGHCTDFVPTGLVYPST